MPQAWSAARVAEVIAALPGGGSRRGSGYRVTGGRVLTAAHVVAGATALSVRFDAGLAGVWTAEATPVWGDTDADLVVLGFEPPAGAPVVTPAPIGRVGEHRAVIDVHTAGFPRWKLRTKEGRPFRDLAYAAGSLAVLANRRGGTLEITVAAPDHDPDPGTSPWEAMSGAAVWAGERLIGVVAEHHRREGLGRLTAVRLDRALTAGPLAALLEVADVAALPDVVPAPGATLTRAGYRELVRDIAPAGGTLDRGAELDELARFCAGDEPYLWWRAGPWAGKSALLSAFVLDPPAGVEVVSFFITARLVTQSDSGAFTDALIEQLAAVAGEQVPPSLTPSGRDAHRRALLQAAAQRTRKAGRRLVLVVDGLDEDTGARPGSGLASIASVLPRAPDDGLRIVVASRPDPPVPADVPADHPLRRCRVRELPASPHAAQVAAAANRELAELLAGDQPHQEVIGLVTASGGGLSLPELEALSGLPRFRLDALLGGVFGRTVGGRDEPGDLRPQRVFLFTHETLRAEAVAHLGAALDGYRARIRSWAQEYADRGWPQDTPAFLLRGYPRMLRALPDPAALVTLATDPARRDLLRALSGGDAAAFAEVAIAQDAVLAADPPDLVAMARLAAARDGLLSRNAAVPPGLPEMWARLGQPARAEALALSVAAGWERASALNGLLRALVETGELDRAERVIDDHVAPRDQPVELSRLAQAAAANGDLARATAVLDRAEADGIASWGPWAGTTLAAAAVALGDLDRAERIALAVTDPGYRARALWRLADHWPPADRERVAQLAEAADGTHSHENPRPGEGVARTRDPITGRTALTGSILSARDMDQAEQLVDLDDVGPFDWARMVTTLATAMAAAGRPDRAAALIERAEGSAGTLSDPWAHGVVWPELVRAATAAGDHDRAAALLDHGEQVAASLTEPAPRAYLLVGLASAAPDRSAALFDRAAHSAAAITDVRQRVDASTDLILAMVAAGKPAKAVFDDVEQAAVAVDEVNEQANLLVKLMETAIAAGDHDRAERLVAAITFADRRHQVVAALVAALAGAGDPRRALRIATAVPPQRARAAAVLEIARVALGAGDRARAVALTRDAERIASGSDAPPPSPWELTALARGFVSAGDVDRAEQVAAAITGNHSEQLSSALSPLIAAVAGTDPDRVERVVAAVANPYGRAELSVTATKAFVAAGHQERASRFAAAVEAPVQRLQALTALVGAADRIVDLAERAAAEIDEPYTRSVLLTDLVRAVAEAGDLDRAVRIANGLPEPDLRVGLLVTLWETAAQAREFALAARIETLIDEPAGWPGLARAAARTGDPDRAAVFLDRFIAKQEPADDPLRRLWTLVLLVEAAVGLPERAAALTDLAEDLLIAPDPRDLADLLPALVAAVAAGGDQPRAERIATRYGSMFVEPDTLLFRAAFAAGDLDRAERLAAAVAEPFQQSEDLLAVLERALADGDAERAERAARAVTDPFGRVRALVRVIGVAADPEPLLHDAEHAAGRIDDPNRQAEMWVALARVAPPAHTARLLAQAFAGGHISIALNALADLAPDLLVRYADERLST
ncbi:serine protease [Asanoa sp. WMMD1127]|uniref:S1 family peptidase n=1 Tax=Asanoa sp. WMMD1127 TaxID=3016107 RepID=UPI00241724C5|nr:serine protease [Asanoa sp. WMMD1127]MDG4827661.1 serine protease [Asanoa sp. WMMD1127]